MASSSSSPEISAAVGAENLTPFSYKTATHDEILEDLTSRFILNLPDEELTSLERICFQVEQAHWYYEDFIREENPRFPSLPLKKFTEMMFDTCPVLQHWNHEEAFDKFMKYKTLVPVCGAIMINEAWDKCVLVKGWKSSSGWGFPKGKINEHEEKVSCAAREVLEETGCNLAGKINPEHYIETVNNGQLVTLFIVPGIPEDYPFRTKTRKEISKIEWFRFIDLPLWRRSKQTAGKFYLITPFINQLKQFVNANKPRKGSRKGAPNPKSPSKASNPPEAPLYTVPESDTLHDSSSQSSSLDNTDPQTPSPQYSESTPAFIPKIAEEQANGLSSIDSLDPHFARLLLGLTVSAAPQEPATTKDVADQTPLSKNSEIPKSEPSSQPSIPLTSPMHTPSHPSSDTKQTPTSNSVLLGQPAQPPSSVPSNSLPLPGNTSKSPPPASLPSDPPGVQPPPTRSPTARKSSTADISPYLTRPIAEAHVSAKRLQELALLESVANESAKMANEMARHSPFPSIRPPPQHPSMPPPVPPFPSNNRGYGYAIGHPVNRYPPPMPHAPPPPQYPPQFSSRLPLYADPLARSRTSQAFHRTNFHSPPGSMSMNQNQLLSLINGARGGPVPPTAGPYPNNSVQSAPIPYPPSFPPSSVHPINGPIPHRNPPVANLSVGPRPYSAAPVGPASSDIPLKAHTASTNTLLSILNSNETTPPNLLPSTISSQFANA